MKMTFALLLGMLLLESCATPITVVKNGNLDPGLEGVCKANHAIFVILIDDQGGVADLACDDIKGKKITKNPVGTLPILNPGTPVKLGEVTKYKASSDPDPCTYWTMAGGILNKYCW